MELIKNIIHEEAERLGITVEKVILFGSRARGCREDSAVICWYWRGEA